MSSSAMIISLIIFSGLLGISIYAQSILHNMFDMAMAQSSSDATSPVTLYNLTIDKATGGFTSLQNDRNDTVWITSGKWSLAVHPSQNEQEESNPITFNATIDMTKTDNSGSDKHEIYDFKPTDGSIRSDEKSSTIVVNGTATITTKEGPHEDVPISIKIIDKAPITVYIDTQTNRITHKWISEGGVFSLWIDPQTLGDKFGNTPIYGNVKKG
jgi:hypothetical protein